METVPSPKAAYKSTEFWVMLAIAGFTFYKASTGESASAEETEVVRDSATQLADAAIKLVEVAGPIAYGIYYTISRGKLKSNVVNAVAKLSGQ